MSEFGTVVTEKMGEICIFIAQDFGYDYGNNCFMEVNMRG